MLLVWIPAMLLWLGALHLHRRTGLPPAAAHLCLLLCGLMGLSAAAMLNLLKYAAWVFFALPLVWTALDLRCQGAAAWTAALRGFFTRPVLLYFAAGALLTLIYLLQQPVFTYWDEFYIWGINAKVMQYSDLLYTVGPKVGSVNYPCGAPMLSYLYQFFAPGFSEAGMLLSYALFYFSVFAAAAELVMNSAAGRQAATLFFAALALTPFLEAYHGHTEDYIFISYGYATSMADLLLGVGMFACAVLYLAAPRKRWYLLALVYTAYIKETGVLPAVIMAVVISVWQLLRAERRDKPALLRWVVLAVGNAAVPAAGYLLWLVHVMLTSGSRPTTPLPGLALLAVLAAAALLWRRMAGPARARLRAACEKLLRVLLRFVLPAVLLAGMALAAWLLLTHDQGLLATRLKALLRLAAGLFIPALRNEWWQQTLNIMWQSFLTTKTLQFGCDAAVAAVLCALAAAAALGCRSGAERRFLLLSQLLLGAGAMLYLYVHSYFVADFLRTMGMVEYGRYFSSYLYAWVYIAVLLALCVPQRAWLGQALALGTFLLCLGELQTVGLAHTVVAAPENYRETTEEWLKKTAQCRDVLQPDDHVYLVFRSLDTDGYLRTVYYLYPAQVGLAKVDTDIDYSIIYCAEADPNDPYSIYYHIADAQQFAEMLCRNFDYVFCIGDAGNYARDYWDVFDGGIYGGMLYRIDPEAKKPARPVEVEPDG